MKAVIAEKPSVAKDIAKFIGASSSRDGYLEGGGYCVTWAFGHLVELAMPEDYGWEGFNRENLPMVPDQFRLVPRRKKEGKKITPDPGVLKQLKVIKELFSKADEIIVATDAGREGELIFRYIYSYLKCKTPFRRLWISSLTDKAIQDGLDNLKPGHDYDNLYISAECRSQADWIVGINASQALCVAAGGNFSLGRVQTPTLRIICERYLENRDFVPRTYWQLQLMSSKDGLGFSVFSELNFLEKGKAAEALAAAKASELRVESVERKEIRQEPPLLYDLTSLQKEANSRLGFSAEKTLSVAQGLYEKKVLSYPRTGSRYVPEDVFETIPDRIALLTEYPFFSKAALDLKGKRLCRKSVDDAKVTDHHALIPTENLPDALAPDERQIYDMVVSRLLEAFGETCLKETTSIRLEAAGFAFPLKGSVIRYPGWRSVRGLQDTEGEENGESGNLPSIAEGERLPIEEAEIAEKQTKPKPLHTESSLLAAMETAGKDIDDAEVRDSMKDIGIGTPATRAAIIETLFRREYIERRKKALVPTGKGLAVFGLVKDMLISDVTMTGRWEAALNRIAKGQGQASAFRGAITRYVRQITSELLALQGASIPKEYPQAERMGECPLCGGTVQSYPKLAKCSNGKCQFKIWKEIAGKKIGDKEVRELLDKKETRVIKGFKSKAGKRFDAALKIEKDRIVFVFPER